MYGWLWNKLPGRTLARVLEALVLALIVVVVLFAFVFPLIEPHLPLTHVNVDR